MNRPREATPPPPAIPKAENCCEGSGFVHTRLKLLEARRFIVAGAGEFAPPPAVGGGIPAAARKTT